MTDQRPTVAIVGFLDTKAVEHAFVKNLLEVQSCKVVVVDVSISVSWRAPPGGQVLTPPWKDWLCTHRSRDARARGGLRSVRRRGKRRKPEKHTTRRRSEDLDRRRHAVAPAAREPGHAARRSRDGWLELEHARL